MQLRGTTVFSPLRRSLTPILLSIGLLALAPWGPARLRAQMNDVYTDQGPEMIGQAAPPWNVRDWINSTPLEISQFRGKVVLLRGLGNHWVLCTFSDAYRHGFRACC